MKKLISLLMVLFVLGTTVSADVGLKHKQKKLKCIQTEYFDIVFAEECLESASHIAANADRIYDQICTERLIEKWIHIPVVITSAAEQFYTNHDTMPHSKILIVDSMPDELSSTTDDYLLDAFRHEVTHIINANYKNSFFKGLGKYTSDFISMWLLTSSDFIEEGSSAVAQSAGKDGPLHDPYYLHHYKQALVEDKFPGVSDVEGVRDVYPSGKEAYFFGGPFTDFIQKEYGMQKYADFIYISVNGAILQTAAFKKAYGISMNQAWEEFKQSIEIPAVKQMPLEEVYVTDFFSQSNELSAQNKHGSLYNSFSSAKDFVGYYEITTGKYFVSKLNSSGSFAKPKVLFTKQDVVNVKFSLDGKLYAVTSESSRGYNKAYEISVHTTEGSGSITLNESNLRDGAIIEGYGSHFLAAVKLEAQYNSLVLYRININENNKITGLDFIRETKLPKGVAISSLTDGGNGNIACIYQKSCLQNNTDSQIWEVALFKDACNDNLREINCEGINFRPDGENFHIKFLTSFIDKNEGVSLAFSWAKDDSFPRLGIIHSEDYSSSVMVTDISGGIYNIACIQQTPSDLPKIVYNSKLYNRDNIYILDTTSVPVKDEKLHAYADDLNKLSIDDPLDLVYANKAVSFKPNILKQSFILPVGIVSSQDSDFNTSIIVPTLGFMWTYYDLWGSKTISTGAAYDLISKTGGFTLGIEGSPAECGTDRLSYSETANVYLDKNGFANAVNNFEMRLQFPVGKVSNIIVEEKNDIFAGHEIKHINFELGGKWVYYSEPESTADILSAANKVGLFYSTKRSAGIGYFEQKGISLGAKYDAAYKNGISAQFDTTLLYQQVSPVISFNIPRLIPITCSYGISYNLPVQIDTSLYPDKSTFLNANAEVIFFAKDFQFVPKFFPFFTRRFIVFGDFYANLMHQNGSMEIVNFIDNAKSIGSMTFSPGVKLTALFNIKIIGLIDNMGINKFGASVIYEPKESKYPKFGFTLNMVF